MFEKATHRLVHQVDYDGALIAVCTVMDSLKLKPLTVVMKRQKRWVWQRTKYRVTDFTLNDLLKGPNIETVLNVTDFVRYQEKQEGCCGGTMKVSLDGASFAAEGNRASKLSSSLGTLRKETVDMQKLLVDSRGRRLDLRHRLIQQTMRKSRQVFTLVVERIFTSCQCTIEYSGLQEGNCGTILKALGFIPSQMMLRQSSSVQYETNVNIEIPPQTVMAYSIRDLNIRSDGQCEISAYPAGFEADGDSTELADVSEVDGVLPLAEIPEGSSLNSLKQVLDDLKVALCVFSHLSACSRSSLLSRLREIIVESTDLSALEEKLEDLCEGEAVVSALSDVSNSTIDNFLNLLESEANYTNGLSPKPVDRNVPGRLRCHTVPAPKAGVGSVAAEAAAFCHVKPPVAACLNGSSSDMAVGFREVRPAHFGTATKRQSVLTAMHMLVSAAEGLTKEGLCLLESLCSQGVLTELNKLVNLLMDNSKPLHVSSLPSALQDEETLQKVERLFTSSNILLQREAKKLRAKVGAGDRLLPLQLCIVVRGLAYLSPP